MMFLALLSAFWVARSGRKPRGAAISQSSNSGNRLGWPRQTASASWASRTSAAGRSLEGAGRSEMRVIGLDGRRYVRERHLSLRVLRCSSRSRRRSVARACSARSSSVSSTSGGTGEGRRVTGDEPAQALHAIGGGRGQPPLPGLNANHFRRVQRGVFQKVERDAVALPLLHGLTLFERLCLTRRRSRRSDQTGERASSRAHALHGRIGGSALVGADVEVIAVRHDGGALPPDAHAERGAERKTGEEREDQATDSGSAWVHGVGEW